MKMKCVLKIIVPCWGPSFKYFLVFIPKGEIKGWFERVKSFGAQ